LSDKLQSLSELAVFKLDLMSNRDMTDAAVLELARSLKNSRLASVSINMRHSKSLTDSSLEHMALHCFTKTRNLKALVLDFGRSGEVTSTGLQGIAKNIPRCLGRLRVSVPGLHISDPALLPKQRRMIPASAMNLCYIPTKPMLKRAGEIIQHLQVEPQLDLRKVAKKWSLARTRDPDSCKGNSLTVFFTDLEPDDSMAIAQLWQWKADAKEINGEPLIIFCTDLSHKGKDSGTVFEKKLLAAMLMLGTPNIFLLGQEVESRLRALEHLESKRAILTALSDVVLELSSTFAITKSCDLANTSIFMKSMQDEDFLSYLWDEANEKNFLATVAEEGPKKVRLSLRDGHGKLFEAEVVVVVVDSGVDAGSDVARYIMGLRLYGEHRDRVNVEDLMQEKELQEVEGIDRRDLVIANRQEVTLDLIVSRMTQFSGSYIDLTIMSPGNGLIANIVNRCKEIDGVWPLRPKWRVKLYSGHYNIVGMQQSDLDAIKNDIMAHAEGPLVDIAKFPFFGGRANHPWTENFTTFAEKQFASDINLQEPTLAAVLKLFSDETCESLIAPSNRNIFKGSTLDDDEQRRWKEIQDIFEPGNSDRLQKYANAIFDDQTLFDKVAPFKKSTLCAMACGGADSALCDQLLFLFAWMQQNKPEHMANTTPGMWVISSDSHTTSVRPGPPDPGEIWAVQPTLKNPRDEEVLRSMRAALHTYLLKSFSAMKKPDDFSQFTLADAGNLCYVASPEVVGKAEGVVRRCNKLPCAMNLPWLLHETGEGSVLPPRDDVPDLNVCGSTDDVNLLDTSVPSEPKERHHRKGVDCVEKDPLMVVVTDFEPDDSMAIAQLWQLRIEMEGMRRRPLVIFSVDFQDKDGGTVFEKKLLVAGLMLGAVDLFMLSPEVEEGTVQGSYHSQAGFVANARLGSLKTIQRQLSEFDGDTVNLYICAPCRGNLHALVEGLREDGAWPLKPKWQVSIYSGQFNMQGMFTKDIAALEEIMGCAEAPLVDLSKYLFFGKDDCHQWTASLSSFAKEQFAAEVHCCSPLLAAALKLLNDEHNSHLVKPKSVLNPKKQLSDEEKGRFKDIEKLYTTSGAPGALKEYAKRLVDDEELFAKVKDFKKSTVQAFAYGACDSPLCDQLLFLFEHLQIHRPDLLSRPSMTPGLWVFNRKSGFTSVDKEKLEMLRSRGPGGGPGGIIAVQPVLRHPKEGQSLNLMRELLQTYLLRHLQSLRPLTAGFKTRPCCAPGETLTQGTTSSRPGSARSARPRIMTPSDMGSPDRSGKRIDASRSEMVWQWQARLTELDLPGPPTKDTFTGDLRTSPW